VIPRHEALFRIVCEETRTIERSARGRVPEADVSDVVQTVLILAWRLITTDKFTHPKTGKRREAIRSWLRLLTWRTARDVLRRQPEHEPIEDFEDALAGPDPEERAIAREELRAVTYRLNRMEARLVLGIVRGETLADMAKALRLPEGTIATRVRMIRRALKKRRGLSMVSMLRTRIVRRVATIHDVPTLRRVVAVAEDERPAHRW
jgi:DNA-directed RNA polymerase specialized sigma24 family protein